MRIEVNGSTHELPPGQTVAALIERIGLAGQPCAVEINRAVVPKRDHAGAELHEGDRIEIVTLVGGG
jgi:sulfur carrier protein